MRGQAGSSDELVGRWPLLLSCFTGMALGIHSLPIYTAGIFFRPLEAAFGWTRIDLSLAPTLLALSIAVAAPFVGWFLDRWGDHVVIPISISLTLLIYLALSFMSGDVRAYWSLFVLLGIFGSGFTTLTLSRVIALHFAKHRGFVLGLSLTGAGIANVIAAPAITLINEDFGWRVGYRVLALVTLAGLPLVALPLWSARGAGAFAKADAAGPVIPFFDVLRRSIFWLLLTPFAVSILATTGLLVHFVSILTDAGMPLARAALVFSSVGVTTIVVRLAVGWLIDRYFAPYVAGALMLIGAVGYGLFAWFGAEAAQLGAVSVGIVMGAEFDLLGFLTAFYFGVRNFSRVYGLCYTPICVCGAMSPVLYGFIRYHGGYGAALWGAAVALALSAVLLLRLPRNDGEAPAAASEVEA